MRPSSIFLLVGLDKSQLPRLPGRKFKNKITSLAAEDILLAAETIHSAAEAIRLAAEAIRLAAEAIQILLLIIIPLQPNCLGLFCVVGWVGAIKE